MTGKCELLHNLGLVIGLIGLGHGVLTPHDLIVVDAGAMERGSHRREIEAVAVDEIVVGDMGERRRCRDIGERELIGPGFADAAWTGIDGVVASKASSGVQWRFGARPRTGTGLLSRSRYRLAGKLPVGLENDRSIYPQVPQVHVDRGYFDFDVMGRHRMPSAMHNDWA